jgi:hypothetical protein
MASIVVSTLSQGTVSTPYTAPPIPKAVIDWLERIFPNDLTQFSGLVDGEVAIREAIGAQGVIARLKREYNKQNG